MYEERFSSNGYIGEIACGDKTLITYSIYNNKRTFTETELKVLLAELNRLQTENATLIRQRSLRYE